MKNDGNEKSRRAFIRNAGIAAGITLLPQDPFSRNRDENRGQRRRPEPTEPETLSATVAFGDGWCALFDSDLSPISASPILAVEATAQEIKNQQGQLAELGLIEPEGPPFTVLGQPDFSPIHAQLLPLVTADQAIDFSLYFAGPELQQSLDSVGIISEHVKLIQSSAAAVRDATRPIVSTFIDWDTPQFKNCWLNIHGPDDHPLTPCRTQSTKHFNFVFYYDPTGRKRDISKNEVANFHIGAYRQGKQVCLILFQNRTAVIPYICWQSCSPTLNGLKQWYKSVIVSAAAAVRVSLPSIMVEAMAVAMAAFSFSLILALA